MDSCGWYNLYNPWFCILGREYGGSPLKYFHPHSHQSFIPDNPPPSHQITIFMLPTNDQAIVMKKNFLL